MSEDDFLWPPETFESNDDPALASKLQHAMDIIFAQLRRLRDAVDAADTSGGGAAHAILSATHSDVTVAAAANGDLLVRSGGAWVRLPAGSAGQALIVVGTAPTWSNDGSALTGVPVAAHDLLSATHADTTAAAAVLGDMIVAQQAGAADLDAYWLDGLPFDDIPNVLNAGDEVYWIDGLPADGLEASDEVRWRRKGNSTTAGYVWTAGATGPDWQPSAAGGAFVQVYRASDFSLPVSTQTNVALEVVVADALGFWAAGSPTRFTVPSGQAGKYVVSGQASIDCTPTFPGNFWVAIYKNSVIVAECALAAAAQIGTRAPMQVTCIADLVAGDFIEMSVYMENSAARNVKGGAAKTFLQLLRVA